jgi:hypothetical protein
MKQESIALTALKGLGFAVFGNVLGGIMTVSLAPFLSEWFIPYIAILLTVFIYGSLLFTAGMKDGQKQAKLLRRHEIEAVPKLRWIWLGLAIGGIMCIPCAVLLTSALGAFPLTGELLLGSYFVLGALAPSFFMIDVQQMSPVFPLILMAVYLIITPIPAQIGYRFGTGDKDLRDFMYER